MIKYLVILCFAGPFINIMYVKWCLTYLKVNIMLVYFLLIGWPYCKILSQDVFGSRKKTNLYTWSIFRFFYEEWWKSEGWLMMLFFYVLDVLYFLSPNIDGCILLRSLSSYYKNVHRVHIHFWPQTLLVY